jgi:hypothetical protein
MWNEVEVEGEFNTRVFEKINTRTEWRVREEEGNAYLPKRNAMLREKGLMKAAGY